MGVSVHAKPTKTTGVLTKSSKLTPDELCEVRLLTVSLGMTAGVGIAGVAWFNGLRWLWLEKLQNKMRSLSKWSGVEWGGVEHTARCHVQGEKITPREADWQLLSSLLVLDLCQHPSCDLLQGVPTVRLYCPP